EDGAAVGMFMDASKVAGCIIAVEPVQKDHAARIRLAGYSLQRLAGAQRVRTERDVGHVATAAHLGAGSFRIGMAGSVERPVEIAYSRQRPAGFCVPQKKQPAQRWFLPTAAIRPCPVWI